MKPPCKDCPDRWAECHAKCAKWAQYEEERDRIYQARKKACELGFILRSLEVERVHLVKTGKLHVKGRRPNGN